MRLSCQIVRDSHARDVTVDDDRVMMHADHRVMGMVIDEMDPVIGEMGPRSSETCTVIIEMEPMPTRMSGMHDAMHVSCREIRYPSSRSKPRQRLTLVERASTRGMPGRMETGRSVVRAKSPAMNEKPVRMGARALRMSTVSQPITIIIALRGSRLRVMTAMSPLKHIRGGPAGMISARTASSASSWRHRGVLPGGQSAAGYLPPNGITPSSTTVSPAESFRDLHRKVPVRVSPPWLHTVPPGSIMMSTP